MTKHDSENKEKRLNKKKCPNIVQSPVLVKNLGYQALPSLSQFDSWWGLRWNMHVWMARNIHRNFISLIHLLPISFFLTFVPHLLYFFEVIALLLPFCLFIYNSHDSWVVPTPTFSVLIFFFLGGSKLPLYNETEF